MKILSLHFTTIFLVGLLDAFKYFAADAAGQSWQNEIIVPQNYINTYAHLNPFPVYHQVQYAAKPSPDSHGFLAQHYHPQLIIPQPASDPKIKNKSSPSSGNKGGNSHQKPSSTVGQETMCHTPYDREDTVLGFLKNGLPKMKPDSKSKHIVIIGGGISGLTAGKLLKDAGHNITILEASNRVGGRIQTYRNLEDNWYNELGPMRIPKSHRLTQELISQFGLKLEPFNNLHHSLFIEDQRLTFEQYVGENPKSPSDTLQNLYSKFNVEDPSEMRAGTELMDEAFSQPLSDLQKLHWKDFLAKYDHYSLKQWLIEYQNLTHSSVNMASLFLNIESMLERSLSEMTINQCDHQLSSQYDQITGGFDLLPRAFLPSIGENIIYKAKVTSISQIEHGVEIGFSCKGIDCPELPSTIKADHVIVTSSAPATSIIDFRPPLSTKKRLAHRSVSYLSATKVLLAFETPFWQRENGETIGGATFTDLNVKQIFYPTSSRNSSVHLLLASYVWGKDADRFDGLSQDEVIRICLEDVAKIHNRDVRFLKSVFRQGIVKSWANDEFTLGAFAFFTPYQYTELNEPLRTPEGDIFFAGEHTSSPHGWINTALKSAVRVAMEVL